MSDWVSDPFFKLCEAVNGDCCGYAHDFKNDTFEMRRYWWGDDFAPEVDMPNFKHYKTGLEVKWYKYPFRDSYSNQDFDEIEWNAVIDDCLGSLKKS